MSVSETNKKNKSSVKRRVAISVLIIAFAFGLNITGILPVLGILNQKISSTEQAPYSFCRRSYICS